MNFNEAVDRIMKMIESESFGSQLAIECIRRAPNDGSPPCWSYSLLNRLLVAFAGSHVKSFLHVRDGEPKEVLVKIGEILADVQAIVDKLISVKEAAEPVPADVRNGLN